MQGINIGNGKTNKNAGYQKSAMANEKAATT
jgi:hypothetical protein